MNLDLFIAILIVLLHVTAQGVFVLRALLRPHREPSSRLAWLIVIIAVPAAGIIAYVLFGETNIGRRRAARYRRTVEILRSAEPPALINESGEIPSIRSHLFRVGHSISGMWPVRGNAARLMPDSVSTIDAMVADIDAAQETVHLLFYIWLADESGLKIVQAACRAARRGVKVRVMADDLGSRRIIRAPVWTEMEEAGVHLVRALPVENLLLHPIRGRVDLRNHRKIVVIDNAVTYCGSQNCADAAFAVKAKYAPWVDLMVRFEGPVALQNQLLFISDWMAHVDEDLRALVSGSKGMAERVDAPGVFAQVIGTGPTVRPTAMPEMFEVLMHGARNELVVTTPYYVPTESMQAALCATARRGVRTILVLPARNDSWVVAAASRSYYGDLIEAGVELYEYPLGMLHAKSLTLDGEVSMIGSANLDRRSFELNYENNILLEDRPLTVSLRQRQQTYMEAARRISAEEVAAWGLWHRLWYNAVAMLGPVL